MTLFLRKQLTADKGGIEITSDPVASSGKVQFHVDRLRELFIVRFHIVNKGANCIHFTYYTALHKIRCFTLEDERRVTRVCPVFLCPGETFERTKTTLKTYLMSDESSMLYFHPQEKAMMLWFGTRWTTMDFSLPQCTLSSAQIFLDLCLSAL